MKTSFKIRGFYMARIHSVPWKFNIHFSYTNPHSSSQTNTNVVSRAVNAFVTEVHNSIMPEQAFTFNNYVHYQRGGLYEIKHHNIWLLVTDRLHPVKVLSQTLQIFSLSMNYLMSELTLLYKISILKSHVVWQNQLKFLCVYNLRH